MHLRPHYQRLAIATCVVTQSATAATQLLGVEPDIGPLDGGTEVRLNIFGLTNSSRVRVTLRGLLPGGSITTIPEEFDVERRNEEAYFVTPDLSRTYDNLSGLLVSIRTASEDESSVPFVGGQLLFRLFPALAALAPVQVRPCCELKLSGGELLSISGGKVECLAPAQTAVVRFRSLNHQEEVVGKLVWGSGEFMVDDLLVDPVRSSWHVEAEAPAWPKAEGHVTLEISWNRQQFTAFAQHLRFIEEESFFGDVAGGISEEHLLPHTHEQLVHSSANSPNTGAVDRNTAIQQMVTVIEEEGSSSMHGRSSDSSHKILMDREGDSFVLARKSDLSYLQEDVRLIHDLFLLTCAATAGGVLASSLGFPNVIGFLLGGAVVGPGGCNSIVMLVQVESVAELGVCLLLFCLGLEFSWKELVANKRAAFAGFLAIVILCGVIIFFATFFSQTPVHEALCIGLFASLSSTPVSLRAIPNSAEGHAEAGVLLPVLITQDMVLAGLLATLPWVFDVLKNDGSSINAKEHISTQSSHKPTVAQVEDHSIFRYHFMIMGVAVYTAMAVIACLYRTAVFRRLEASLSMARSLRLDLSGEFFGLLVLSYVFALSYITDRFGLSLELGSFAAGLIITSISHEAAESARLRLGTLREIFGALFFASIGLVVNGRFLLDNLAALMSVVWFIFVLKASTAFLPLWLLTTNSTAAAALSSLRISCILAHVGEFGFVLAAKGASWGALSRHVYLLLIGANAVSLCTTPWLFRALELTLPREEDMSSFLVIKRANTSPSHATWTSTSV